MPRKMMPIGPLMIEHRLIERMIALMRSHLTEIDDGSPVDVGFLRSAIDFLRNYADRCHHGKEEGILFRQLSMRDIPNDYAELLAELSDEHATARHLVRSLASALDRHTGGDADSRAAIGASLLAVTNLYPLHIAKEDRRFFIPVMQLFSEAERDAMLAEGFALDSQLLQEAYRQTVMEQETQRRHR